MQRNWQGHRELGTNFNTLFPNVLDPRKRGKQIAGPLLRISQHECHLLDPNPIGGLTLGIIASRQTKDSLPTNVLAKQSARKQHPGNLKAYVDILIFVEMMELFFVDFSTQ